MRCSLKSEVLRVLPYSVEATIMSNILLPGSFYKYGTGYLSWFQDDIGTYLGPYTILLGNAGYPAHFDERPSGTQGSPPPF